VRTIIVGNRKLARQLLLHAVKNDWNIVGAVIPNKRLAAEQANFKPVEDIIEGTECQLHRTEDINAGETVTWLRERAPDLCLCGGWSQIIDERVLNVPDQGFLGLHSSRLPEGRGGAPVNWGIINGNSGIWISVFYYVSGVDAGDVLAQGSVPVEERDDVRTVFDRLAVKACELVGSVHDNLVAERPDPEPQALTDATYRPRRQPQDGLIDWERSPHAQYDWIRAQTEPYPGAYTFHNRRRLTVWQAHPIEEDHNKVVPGTVIRINTGDGVDVCTGDGAIRLTRVQREEHPPRWADEYAVATGVKVGDRLGRHTAPDNWLYTGIQGPTNQDTFETNLKYGDTGAVDIVALSGSTHDVTVRVTLEETTLFEQSTTVSSEYRKRVVYAPDTVGTHALTITFESDSRLIDERHLKVFVHEG
jgi:methionyl-tRNA formyltransferase